jgi:hypothetical protein
LSPISDTVRNCQEHERINGYQRVHISS